MVKRFFLTERKRYTPADNIEYLVPSKAIDDTEKILSEYEQTSPSSEGWVYWGGTREQNKITVSMVIAPQAEASFGRVSTSNLSNFHFVRMLNKHGLFQVAQVHSHPPGWVDHSDGDNEWAPFKVEGLLSIVVPEYCRNGMLPLTVCGVHRFADNRFIRLSDNYVKRHFKIVDGLISGVEDLR